ncbi:pentapeptide repeat-containing protein [Accumulibacter sp.]|uniref:pentapeptide repeat-containing protein n=1 Tax=Accumulibacter sp. TaxID=2053492 RepID=UPI0025E4F2C8|nr:pentapeptide repeat-containing protein [Accumulibacter sp.]MCM8612190.1 pentapeptide repeat-containing protein [Accumulibacter sp.]MCM8635863.1 pentapeptide repeat-containing protein [Accumulibacter sp.]MCM8639528.1 pentapeptide repeat-containing protein [Accumulibacter sp.]
MQEAVLQAVEQHGLWLASQRAQGRQAVLTNVDLRFADLSGRDLREAVFTKVDLERANLKGCRLAAADLRESNLSYAELQGADLSGANLAGARVVGADLTATRLDGATLVGAFLDAATLREATLLAVNARRARFTRANMEWAVLDGGQFEKAIFNAANLTQASLCEAQLPGAFLRRTILSGTDLDGANFRDADLTEAVLVGASLAGANFDGARVLRTRLEQQDSEAEPEGGAGRAKTDGQRSAVPLKGLSLAPNEQLRDLLSEADELKAALRREEALAQSVTDGVDAADVAASAARQSATKEQIREVEARIRVVQTAMRREQERVERLQAEVAARVESATTALRSALVGSNRMIRAQQRWSIVYRVLTLLAVLASLAVGGLLAWGLASTPKDWLDKLVWLALVALPLLIASLAVWLDLQAARRIRRSIARRERIDDMIGLLTASQFISLDVSTNLSSLETTFAAVRQVLLQAGSGDTQAKQARGG